MFLFFISQRNIGYMRIYSLGYDSLY